MEYAIFIIILAVLKESHPLNPEIHKYDQYMKDFETTGRRIKQEAMDQKMDGPPKKRESVSTAQEDEGQDRDRKFREKYCGKGYTPWENMQNADNDTLANICWKFFTYEGRADVGASEAKRMIEHSAIYGREDEVVLDIIQCKVRYRNFRDQFVGEAIYYLGEGSEADKAFKFLMIPALENKTKIILSSVVKNVWNQTIASNAYLGSISALDLGS